MRHIARSLWLATILGLLPLLAFLNAKPAPSKPEPPPDILGLWHAFESEDNPHFYRVTVYKAGEQIKSEWRASGDNQLCWRGAFAWKEGAWIETYDPAAPRTSGPWTWMPVSGTQMNDARWPHGWSLQRPEADAESGE